MNKRDLGKIVEEENQNWTKIFQAEMEKPIDERKDFSSYWWKLYYGEIVDFVNKELSCFDNPKILENGSGSGKSSILLGKNIDRTFLDISKVALQYAKFLANSRQAENIKYVEGDIFDMPFQEKEFDFVWNIGVLEHYDYDEAVTIARNMIRVVKSKGKIAFGVPNFYSGPILKARVLKLDLFKKIPGYRLGTEKRYSIKQLISILESGAKLENRIIIKKQFNHFGHPLIMEAPKTILKITNSFCNKYLSNNKFLIFLIATIE